MNEGSLTNNGVNTVMSSTMIEGSKKPKENKREQQINSFVPTWAWPASLRNNESIKLISLFYTAETNVPLSPTQVGGASVHIRPSKIGIPKNHASRLSTNRILESINTYEQKPKKCSIIEKNKDDQREKLRSRYGAPFSWIRNRAKDVGMNKSPIIGSSDISTPRSHVFTEIPKQPSIYPFEQQFEMGTVNNSKVSEFIKRTLKMQRTLELLLDNNQWKDEVKFNALSTPIRFGE